MVSAALGPVRMKIATSADKHGWVCHRHDKSIVPPEPEFPTHPLYPVILITGYSGGVMNQGPVVSYGY